MPISSHSKLRATLGLAALFCVALTTSCRRGTEGARPSAALEPVRGGTTPIGINSDIGGVNELIVPAANITDDILYKVFLRLWEEQPDFTQGPAEMKPALVDDGEEAAQWDAEHKVLTLRLRKAFWDDGQPITAEDVRWTWQMQTNPAIAWDGASAKRFIEKVETDGEQIVRFHFSQVYPRQVLDVNEGVILPKHVWSQIPPEKWRESGDWFYEHRVASGPFRIESWKPQAEIVLARNPKYFEPELPRLDRVVLRIVPDQTAQLAQLLNGELLFITNLKPEDSARIQPDPKLELIAIDFRNSVSIAWNNQNELFRDPETRRALTLAIDRARMVQAIWGPYARIASSPILSFVWAHDKTLEPWPFDPAAAKKILAERGFRDTNGDGVLEKNGKNFEFELLVNSGNQQRADAAVMIQSQLASVGVTATPRTLEATSFNTQIDQGNYAAAILGFGMDTSLDFTSFLSSKVIGKENNFARYSNPEVDRLLDEAATQKDLESTVPSLRAIEKILHQEQPYTYLWESQRLSARNRSLRWDWIDRAGKPRESKPTMTFTLFGLRDWWLEPKPAN